MSGKNLIMGLWSNLPFEGLERFIASLRRTTYAGDLCVFVDEVPASTARSLLAHGVIVERATRFALPQMNQTYGEAMADNLGHCMISCSGTTFGTVHGMQQYLAVMFNEIASRPIVSSAVLRGKLGLVREFYRGLLAEFVGRRDLLRIPKVIQGAINRVSRDGAFSFPVIVHPNAAEVYFEIGPQSLTHDIRLGVRTGGTVSAIVVNPFHETPLMSMLKASLHL